MATLSHELASLCSAIRNCRAAGNDEWLDRHSTRIRELASDMLPHGSGIDCGCEVDIDASGDRKLVPPGPIA